MNRWMNHRAWIAPVSLIYVLALTVPVVFLVVAASEGFGENFIHLYQTSLSAYIFETAMLLPGVALLSILIGVGAAWFTTAYDFPGRRWLTVLLATPFCIPPFIHGFIYNEIFGVGGSLYQWLDSWFDIDIRRWPNIRSLWGASIVFSLSLYPYIYLPARIVFLNLIGRYRTAAATLCASENKFFFGVVLPLASGTILSGLALVWMDVISDYGLVEYFGVNTISIGILRAWHGLGDLNLAALLSVLALIGVSALLVVIYACKRLFIRKQQTSVQTEFTAPPVLKGAKGLWVCALCFAVVVMVFALPMAQLLFWVLAGWGEIDFARLFEVSFNTVILSLGSGVLLLVLSFALCYAGRAEVSQTWRRWYRRLRACLTVSYALPGVVVATGVIAGLDAINQWLGLAQTNLFTVLFGLVPVLFACQLRFSAVALNNFEPALEQISRETDDSARTLGVGGLSLLRRIFLPIMANPIRTVFILLTINLLKELPMTAFLRPIGFDTLAVDSFLKILDERLVQAAPGALVIVLVSLALFALLLRAFALGTHNKPV